MSERAYTAKAFEYLRTQTDCVLGMSPTAYDAKIACEHHAGQPLQWIEYGARDSGPYSYAFIYAGEQVALAYLVHQRSEE